MEVEEVEAILDDLDDYPLSILGDSSDELEDTMEDCGYYKMASEEDP